MDAIIAGEEELVDPSPEWVRKTLQQVSRAADENDRFVCLIRDGGDQMNALCVDGAWVMEWYRSDMGGHMAGFRTGQAPDRLPRRRGFLASLFKGPSPLNGSRISSGEAAAMLDSYVAGAQAFAGFEWVGP